MLDDVVEGRGGAAARDTVTRRKVRARAVAPLLAMLVLGTGSLAACGSSSSTTSSNTTASTSTSSSSDTSGGSSSSSSDTSSSGSGSTGTTNEQAYVSAIQSQAHFTGLSQANLLKLGNAVCSDFAQGNTLTQTENDVLSAVKTINQNDAESGNNPGGNLDAHDAGFLIGAAVTGLCPQYSGEVPTS